MLDIRKKNEFERERRIHAGVFEGVSRGVLPMSWLLDSTRQLGVVWRRQMNGLQEGTSEHPQG